MQKYFEMKHKLLLLKSIKYSTMWLGIKAKRFSPDKTQMLHLAKRTKLSLRYFL